MNKKEFKHLERTLINSYEKKNDKIIVDNNDFDEDGLTIEGFSKIKQKLEYVSIDDTFDIVVSNKKDEVFRNSLIHYVSKELFIIKKQKDRINKFSIIFLLIGILVMIFYYLFSKTYFLSELFIIISWVFIWAAVEKIFFEKAALKRNRIKLLILISSVKM